MLWSLSKNTTATAPIPKSVPHSEIVAGLMAFEPKVDRSVYIGKFERVKENERRSDRNITVQILHIAPTTTIVP